MRVVRTLRRPEAVLLDYFGLPSTIEPVHGKSFRKVLEPPGGCFR